MKKRIKAIIFLGIIVCVLVAISNIMPLNEDPPSALSSPAYSYTTL